MTAESPQKEQGLFDLGYGAVMAEDVDRLLTIERQAYGNSAWSATSFEAELNSPDRWYWCVRSPDVLCGYVGLAFSPPDCDLMTLTVANQFRGRGLGRELLNAAVAEAVERGCHRMFAEVRYGNEPALALYRSIGFERLGRRPNYYGTGIDAHNLRLRLNAPTRLQEVVDGR